jgi:hypothetical protein
VDGNRLNTLFALPKSFLDRKVEILVMPLAEENAAEKESELKVWKGLTSGMKTPIHIAKSWDDPDSCLNNPIHIGKDYRKITREEIYDECINRLGCMKGKK